MSECEVFVYEVQLLGKFTSRYWAYAEPGISSPHKQQTSGI